MLSLSGCVTTQVIKEPLPAVLDPYFNVCAPADGMASFQVFDGEALIGSGDLEWTAGRTGDWESGVVSPLGQTLLRVRREGDQITSRGGLASKLPTLQIREDGFLEVDGHFIGLKASEVPCLLGFRLPRGWLGSLSFLKNEPGQTTAQFRDGKRVIDFAATGMRQGGIGRICNQIQWRSFVGLVGTKVEWCQDLQASGKGATRRQAYLNGLENYSIRWTDINEP